MQLPEEGLDELLSVSAFSTTAAIYPPVPVAGSCVPVLGATYTQLVESKLDKKDPVLQTSGICILIAVGVSDHKDVDKEQWPLLLHILNCFKPLPLQLR